MNTLQLNGLHKDISKLDDRLNNSQIYEYPKATDPVTGADSSLIEQCNFFIEENVRLENYIIELEQENQILGSALAQKEKQMTKRILLAIMNLILAVTFVYLLHMFVTYMIEK